MIEEILKDIIQESKKQHSIINTERNFIEIILDKIYQFLNKSGQPVHTIAIGILRVNTFDMYYRGRLLEKFAETFGAMSYETTMAGRACELYKKEGKKYLHLYSRKKIIEEFELASKELKASSLKEEAESLRKRGRATIDQGVGSLLLIPISFGENIIGIFTISSLRESDKNHIMGENVEQKFLPLAQMLSLILFIEKISYDKAEEMGRLLISSIDGKDEYQSTHSLNVRTIIDMFINELSRDKELRERAENLGLILTVDRIEKLRLAALLHDIGKVFIPSKILQKSQLSKKEILIRKIHPYLTYNTLVKSKTLKDIAEIASMHHALYFIPVDRKSLDDYTKIETDIICLPFDTWEQNKSAPESQIIALADVLNAIVRSRPGGKGLNLSKAMEIIEADDYKFHGGLKDIFLTVVNKVEHNLAKGKYLPQQTEDYRNCLWLEDQGKEKKKENAQWSELHKFLNKIKFNHLGIVSVIDWKDASSLLKEEIKIRNKPIRVTKIQNKHILISIINIPKEEGFVWIDNLFNYLRSLSFNGKIAFAFIGKRGHEATIEKIYESLQNGLMNIQNEPVHCFLDPQMYKCE